LETVLGKGVEVSKYSPMGTEMGISLMYHLMDSLYKDVPGLLLETQQPCSFDIFA
jgi:hypothetical protein